MSTEAVQNYQEMSPADYKDFDLDRLRVVGDYIARNSIPQGLTISESNHILQLYTELINLSLHNLNLLRTLAGDDLFPIPEQGENNDVPEMG